MEAERPRSRAFASVVSAVWVAHLYAHALSESIERRQRVTLDDLERIAHRELGILFAAALPVLVLLLGAVGVLKERTAIWLALGVAPASASSSWPWRQPSFTEVVERRRR